LASRDGKIVCENTLDARLDVVFRKKLPEVPIFLSLHGYFIVPDALVRPLLFTGNSENLSHCLCSLFLAALLIENLNYLHAMLRSHGHEIQNRKIRIHKP